MIEYPKTWKLTGAGVLFRRFKVRREEIEMQLHVDHLAFKD